MDQIQAGPPRDGIPALDQPKFEKVEAVGAWSAFHPATGLWTPETRGG